MAEEYFKHINAEEFDALDFDQVTLLSSVPKDKPVIVYCKVGLWSEEIAEVLADRGYDVATLDGGYNKYLALLYGL